MALLFQYQIMFKGLERLLGCVSGRGQPAGMDIANRLSTTSYHSGVHSTQIREGKISSKLKLGPL